MLLTALRDHVVYIPSQKQGIINTWDYTYNLDQPKNSTIGPAFWESLNVLTGTKYIFGLNFYKNDSSLLTNLQHEVNQTLCLLPPERLYLFELGNENDYGANSGFRPRNWTQGDYVEEWVYRTRHVQTTQHSLRFFAPSFCCFVKSVRVTSHQSQDSMVGSCHCHAAYGVVQSVLSVVVHGYCYRPISLYSPALSYHSFFFYRKNVITM